jgi:hypothetical protein
VREFDPGYGQEPFRTLVERYPGREVYPPRDFRIEWGPIFHRGRLDGSARLLVIGPEPGVPDTVVRRVLVGEAGQRVQGFLAKLGLERSYVMLNVFLYGLTAQTGGERHRDDPAIAAYRDCWLDALLVGTRVEAVVAFGRLADAAFQQWRATPAGRGVQVAYARLPEPLQPENSHRREPARRAEATRTMLLAWNQALQVLRPLLPHPDVGRPLVLYGDGWVPGDRPSIPARDLPPGLPDWMASSADWAERRALGAVPRRAALVVTVPRAARGWSD